MKRYLALAAFLLATPAAAEVIWVDCGPIPPPPHTEVHHAARPHVHHGLRRHGVRHCRRVLVHLRRLCPLEVGGGGSAGEEASQDYYGVGDSGSGGASGFVEGLGGGLGREKVTHIEGVFIGYLPPGYSIDSLPRQSITDVPELPTWAMVALGFALLFCFRARKKIARCGLR